jgi:hypothetical protein
MPVTRVFPGYSGETEIELVRSESCQSDVTSTLTMMYCHLDRASAKRGFRPFSRGNKSLPAVAVELN